MKNTALLILGFLCSFSVEAQVTSKARNINGTIEGVVIEAWQSIHSYNVAVKSNGSRYEFCTQCQGGIDDSPQIIGDNISKPGTLLRITYSKIEHFKTYKGESAFGIEARRIVELGNMPGTQKGNWSSFWNAFRIAVIKQDRLALKRMIGDHFDGDASSTPDGVIRRIDEEHLWSKIKKSVTTGTKLFAIQGRETNDGFLIFNMMHGRWYWDGFAGD